MPTIKDDELRDKIINIFAEDGTLEAAAKAERKYSTEIDDLIALIHTHDMEVRKSHYDYNMKGSWIFIGDIDKLNSLNDLYWSYVMEVVAEADPRAVERGIYSIDYIKNNMKHASWGSVGIHKILARADQRAKERIAELKALQSKKKGIEKAKSNLSLNNKEEV